jgi:DNA-binding CsgD family transcriptional regulator
MWQDVELRELRIFLTLADELHFGRTAERLGVSQPGVSEAVRILESRLGVKIFDRTSRRVRLTPAGEELKRSLLPTLAALDQAPGRDQRAIPRRPPASASSTPPARRFPFSTATTPSSSPSTTCPHPLGLVWCTSRENPRTRALNDVASSMGGVGSPTGSPPR